MVPQESRESSVELYQDSGDLGFHKSLNANDLLNKRKIVNFSEDFFQLIDFSFMKLRSKTFLEAPSTPNPLVHDLEAGGLPLTQPDSVSDTVKCFTHIIPFSPLGSITIPLQRGRPFGSVSLSDCPKVKEAK